MFKNTVRIYLRRFWLDITLFWMLSSAATWLAWRDPAMQTLSGMAVLESLALLVASLRILQAEDTFATLGGWQVRPVNARTLRLARWGLFALLLLPPVLVRIAVSVALFAPGPAECWVLAVQVWLPLLGGCLCGAAAAGGVGRASGLMWGVIVFSACCGVGYFISRTESNTFSNHLSGSRKGVAINIFRAESRMLKNGVPRDFVSTSPLVRLPLRPGAEKFTGGCRVVLTECALSSGQARVTVEITVPGNGLRPWKIDGTYPNKGLSIYLRFADGTWAGLFDSFFSCDHSPLPGFGVERFRVGGSIGTPLAFPENDQTWEQLAAGAECVIFAREITGTAKGDSSPWPPLPDVPRTWDPNAPAPVLSPAAATAEAAFAEFSRAAYAGEAYNRRANLLKKFGPDGFAEALRYLWEQCFEDIYRSNIVPMISAHATLEHLPLLLQELEIEPYCIRAFIKKGWQAQALPILRRQLQDGLPLPGESLDILAGEGDIHLAPMLYAAAIRCGEPTAPLLAKLAAHPGIDWPKLVAEAWRYQRFDVWQRKGWREAAARMGEKAALRELAGSWLDKGPNTGTVSRFITLPDAIQNIPAWLRANFDRLQWDAGAARWVLP